MKGVAKLELILETECSICLMTDRDSATPSHPQSCIKSPSCTTNDGGRRTEGRTEQSALAPAVAKKEADVVLPQSMAGLLDDHLSVIVSLSLYKSDKRGQ